MKIVFLSASGYKDPAKNYGDCILIDTETELIIYDCGSYEHATRVLEYMRSRKYDTAKFVLSHNDSDHFNGLNTLIEANAISGVYTLLLLKYKDELLKLIDDGRISDASLTKKIEETYDNIYSLSGKVKLIDALTLPQLCPGVQIIGPKRKTALEAVAKFLDGRQGNTLDDETIFNAICFQLKITMDDNNGFLLCGDSAFSMIEDSVKDMRYIQLPHHGKCEIAEKIFEAKKFDINAKYYVSDNTGNSNGGSDKLVEKSYGHHVEYTKHADIIIGKNTTWSSPYVAGKSYGNYQV